MMDGCVDCILSRRTLLRTCQGNWHRPPCRHVVGWCAVSPSSRVELVASTCGWDVACRVVDDSSRTLLLARRCRCYLIRRRAARTRSIIASMMPEMLKHVVAK